MEPWQVATLVIGVLFVLFITVTLGPLLLWHALQHWGLPEWVIPIGGVVFAGAALWLVIFGITSLVS